MLHGEQQDKGKRKQSFRESEIPRIGEAIDRFGTIRPQRSKETVLFSVHVKSLIRVVQATNLNHRRLFGRERPW